VKPTEKGWRLIRQGRPQPVWQSKRRTEVLQYARRVARSNRPCRIVVHIEDGSVETEEFYDRVSGEPELNGRRW
jgi:hypothetical protein